MKECYFDPAMQAHKTRMQQVYRWQRRRALGVFVGILEVLQANGTEISTYALNSFIDQLQSLKNDFEEILLKQEEKDDNL